MMRDRAARIPSLEQATNSPARLGAGVGAFVAGFGGAVLAGAAADYAATHGSDTDSTIGLLVGLPLAAAGAVVGTLVWRSGRAVNNALIAWEELPDYVGPDGARVDRPAREAHYAENIDSPAARRREWINNRTRLITPPRVLRLALGSLTSLAALALVLYVMVGPGRDENLVTGLTAGAAAAFAGVVTFGGQLRFGACLSRRELRLGRLAKSRRHHDTPGK